MGRWTQYDEDDYRLPEGMKRVGYDADTGRYYFRDSDGAIWRSAEGSQYGELTKVAELPSSLASTTALDDDDLEAAPTHSNGYQLLSTEPNVRQLLHLTNFHSDPAIHQTQAYFVQPGDSCWEIANTHGISLDKLQTMNPKLQCEPLLPGSTVCLPQDT
ncbi:hypothetical protein AN958_10956 [Leucoagaricus sp. SymC.cos]|nr:hypothetical protein AN958_10956 [Leucoagaricus sp. SymC.cos]